MNLGCNFCLADPFSNPELFKNQHDPFLKEGYLYYEDGDRGWKALKVKYCPICGRSLEERK